MNTSIIAPVSHGVSTGSLGTTVNDGSGADTWTTSFVEIVSSLATNIQGFWLACTNANGYMHEYQLFAGGAGSETMFCHGATCGGGFHSDPQYIPISLPSGTRISAKIKNNSGFQSVRMHIIPCRGGMLVPSVGVGWLVGTTSAEPTGVDAGATANTKGAWAQVVSSSDASRHAKGFSVHFAADASVTASNSVLWDIGIGGSGSEQIILADFPSYQEGYRAQCDPMSVGPIWTPIPAGSRIAARCQSSSTAADSRVPRIALTLWG